MKSGKPQRPSDADQQEKTRRPEATKSSVCDRDVMQKASCDHFGFVKTF